MKVYSLYKCHQGYKVLKNVVGYWNLMLQVCICDWICNIWSKSHKNWNPFYCWTLHLNSCTTQIHQTHGYRWPNLLSQMAFCSPNQTTEVHYRVFGGSEWHYYGCEWCQTAANNCLDVSCGLSAFLPVLKTQHCRLCPNGGITNLQLPTTHPTSSQLSIPYNMPSVIL